LLGDASSFPRTRAAFSARVDQGKLRLPSTLAELGKLAQDLAVELDRVRAMLRAMTGAPGSPKGSLDDVRTQLEYLVPPDILLHAPRERLLHVPRYLRAIQVRLERMPYGPQKDQAKAELVLPFWNDWLKHHDGLRARGVPEAELEAFRFLVEEYRVSIFAPEVRAAVSISPQRLTDSWAVLLGRS
jgi:ATP-dependent helicase HrpA